MKGYLMPPGRSILDQLWVELDVAYARSVAKKCKNRHISRGVSVGIAHAIAIMTNPYAPNINAVQIQAQERYEDGRDGAKSADAKSRKNGKRARGGETRLGKVLAKSGDADDRKARRTG